MTDLIVYKKVLRLYEPSWLLGWASPLRKVAGLAVLLLAFSGLAGQMDEGELLKVVQEQKGDTTEALALNNLYRITRSKDPQQAILYLESAEALVEKLDYPRGRAKVWRSYGDWYMVQGDYERASVYLHKSKDAYAALGIEGAEISCSNGLGLVAVRQGNFSLALEHFFAEATYYEEKGNQGGLANAFMNIGSVHLTLERYSMAQPYIEKSLAIREALGDSAAMVPVLNALAGAYSGEGKYKESLRINHWALGISQRYADPYATSLILDNIGVQHQKLDQPDSARFYYLQALETQELHGDPHELSVLYINLGEVELQRNQPQEAIAYYDSSLAISTDIGALEYETFAYRGLANAHEMLGDFQQAHRWLEKYHALEDSMAGERVQKTIHELEAKYEAGQKDKQIAVLEQKKAEAASDADRKRVFLTVAISGAVVVVLFFLFFIGRNRIQEKQRRAELEQKALRSQMNPHFIFNSLGAIQSMYMGGELDLANNYMGDFGRLMRKILENSAKDTISVKEELDMLRLYLGLERERNSGRIDFEFVVDDKVDRMGTFIPPMVIQPFVENAIWHGIVPSKRPGLIRIHLRPSPKEGLLQCEVEDNGVGISLDKKRKGYVSKGISITEQRLGHKVQFTDLSPGTRVTIFIPS